MLDPKILRDDVQQVVTMLKNRNQDFDLDYYLNLENQRKVLQKEVEDLQSERNSKSKSIGIAKSKGEDVSAIMQSVATLGDDLKAKQDELNIIQVNIKNFCSHIPNLLNPEVPLGKDEADNKEIKKWGSPKIFDFEPKDHVDLGLINHNGIDMEMGAKLSGSRFVVLRNKIAKLHRSLAQFMLNLHTQEHGYMEVNVPFLVSPSTMEGSGQLPKFEEDLFFVEGNNNHKLGLIPTSEVPLVNLVAGQIIDQNTLPLKYTAHSCCFRKEAGSYGKDTRGMIRVHQFEKVELVQITKAQDSYQALELMLQDAEKVLQLLELPYRVVELCSGDIGFCAAKTYDIEVWLPSQNCYREISSCSNCTDFQARRITARIKNKETNKTELVHTLNGSGVAVGRALVAVLENYQQADGSIVVPKVLREYMGCDVIKL